MTGGPAVSLWNETGNFASPPRDGFALFGVGGGSGFRIHNRSTELSASPEETLGRIEHALDSAVLEMLSKAEHGFAGK